jgi:hypothetical protein
VILGVFGMLIRLKSRVGIVSSYITLVLIFIYLAIYRITLLNYVFSIALNFIKDILVSTLQNYYTNNQRSTRYNKLQDPDNINQIKVYSGTTRATLQPVVVPTSVPNFYAFINSASFLKPKGKAIQINIIWRYNRTNYS